MKNVYEQCPILENEDFMLRLVNIKDKEELLKVYGDEKAVSYFNSDNCDGDDFHYTTLKRVEEAINFWIWSYENKWFVRWSIIDKNSNEVVGTIELFNRVADDYFNGCGLLRLDLRSDYEKKESISKILSVIIGPSYELFNCNIIATKAKSFAIERIKALENYGFRYSNESVVGNDGTKYGDYWICEKQA